MTLVGQTTDTLANLTANHPFLSGLDPRFCNFLNECASVWRLGPSQDIFREHGNADSFYLIQSGRVALDIFVPRAGVETIQTLESGEALGWSWLFPPYRWHFTAKAIEPTELIGFDAAHLRERMQEDRDFGNELLARIACVLYQRLQATRRQLIGFYGIIE